MDEANGANAFAMRPDIVGMRDGRAAWIIDTKWKQLSPDELREGAVQSDMYQMYAYASSYGCTDVVLLYPHHGVLGKQGGERTSYRMHAPVRTAAGFGAGRIRIATVDLSDLGAVPAQLRSLFPEQSAQTVGAMAGSKG